jgi:hypothetical protein
MARYTLEKDIWDYLIEKRELVTTDLVTHFMGRGVTKQGVHRVLRSFEKEGRIIRLRNYVAVNLIWVEREIEKLGSIVRHPEMYFDTFEKKRTYTVHTLEELDQLWGQLFITLVSSHVINLRSALFYDLHNYTYIHKVPLIEWYIDFLYARKEPPKICLLVGSHSALDTALARQMKRISVYQIEKKWTHIFCVLDDFVVYNYVDRAVWKRIEEVFTHTDIDRARDELIFLSRLKGSYKITVERNTKKAADLRRQFGKYFVLP